MQHATPMAALDMAKISGRLEKPSLFLLMAEIRAVAELGAAIAATPALMAAKRGDGHPVLTLPGFLAGDTSTGLLRRFLSYLDYEVHPWQLGRNVGGVYRMRNAIRSRIEQIYKESGRKVSLVGWSLGGIYARDAALHMPDKVRSVITLGSPFARGHSSSNVSSLYEKVSGESYKTANPADIAALAGAMPVPATAIYSRYDGIVNWRTSVLEENDTSGNIEILYGSHNGLGVHPAALWAVADRLAMPEGEYWPFDSTGPFRFFYPSPARPG